MNSRLLSLAFVPLSVVVGLLPACSTDESTLPRNSKGSAEGTSSGDPGGNGGNGSAQNPNGAAGSLGIGPGEPAVDPDSLPPPTTCNFGDNVGTDVRSTRVGEATPAGTGGEFLDGQYLLTEVTHYENSGAVATYKGLLKRQSGGQNYILSKNGVETRTTMGATVQGATMTLRAKCGTTETQNLTYTAVSETELVLYNPSIKTSFRYKRPPVL